MKYNYRFKMVVLLYFFSFFLSELYIDLGFSLKAFMFLNFFLFMSYSVSDKFVFYADKYDFVFLLFILYGGSTVIFSNDVVSGARMLAGSLIVFFTYFVLKCFLIKNFASNLILFERYICAVGFLFSSISLMLYFLGVNKIDGDFGSYESIRIYGVMIDRGIPRLIGVLSDPNIYVFYSSIFFFYLFFKKGKSLFEMFSFFMVSLAMLLSLSRGGAVSIIFPLFLYFTFSFLRNAIHFKINSGDVVKVAFCVSFVSLLIFYSLSNDYAFSIFEKRISDAMLGSGRLEIWKNSLTLIEENFVFGIGWYNFLHYNVELFSRYNYAHNTFLEVFVELGVIGFSLYVSFYVMIFFKLVSLVRFDSNFKFLLVCFSSMFIALNSLSLLINEVLFFYLAVVSFYFHCKKRAIDDNDNYLHIK
ncbi:O-antigen ligase family protein [Zobellella denitrificans]